MSETQVIMRTDVEVIGKNMVFKKGEVYNASPATHLPDYKSKQLYLVKHTNGSSIVLSARIDEECMLVID